MKAFLMYKDHDFDIKSPIPANEGALTQDLELNILFNTMARGDAFLFDVAKRAVLSSLGDPDEIRYRQDILKDCLKNASIIREIYQIPIESNEQKHKHWLGVFSTYPDSILHGSIDIMEMFVGLLKKLRTIADEHADKFSSEGFRVFFAMIQKELDDEYFAIVQNHLRELRFDHGMTISAELGNGNEGSHYVLRKPETKKQRWVVRLLENKSPAYSFSISTRDEYGARALGTLKDRGINLVANALAQSADHIDSFFDLLRVELAFYMGCLNLYESLDPLGEPVSFPTPVPANERKLTFTGLYDVCQALTMKQKIVGNDVNADDKDLVIITGANQGGKSTFLRSIGLAQLMLQAGMFTPAESFLANLCDGLFTHYKREEDTTMKSGKLDEELSRMSEIVDRTKPNSMVLFNESFAATNEREGSEIARQIVNALLEEHTKVFYVTHQYELARGFYERKMGNAIFLRAGRLADGGRTFKLTEGKPLQTSFGEDLYNKIFKGENLPEKI